MKSLLFISMFTFMLVQSQTSFAQASPKKETFKVSGECKSCKKKIEASALKAGADKATWNVATKMLNVYYVPGKTDAAKIQQTIAAAGYDTPGFAADSSAYNNLDECCKYERKKGSQ